MDKIISNQHILIVDDESKILSSLYRTFRPLGYTIYLANSGAEGLQIISKHSVDVVISDMNMPNMSGDEFLSEVANISPKTIRIVLTGFSNMDATINAINEGKISRYIKKPWNNSDIISTIQKAIEEQPINDSRSELTDEHHKLNLKIQNIDSNLSNKEETKVHNKKQLKIISAINHELKTPLSSIIGFTRLLEASKLNKDQSECVSHILKSGHYLLEIINQTLDLTNIEFGQKKISLEKVELKETVDECLSIINPLLKKDNIEINFSFPSFRADILADPLCIKQVIINILSNAVKYNRTNGSITATITEHEQSHLRLWIEDSGRGIPIEKQSLLFHEFERAIDKNSQIDGAGIGLFISKKIIELMGGKIGMTSKINKGSCFWIELQKYSDHV